MLLPTVLLAQLELPYSVKVLNPKPLDAYYYNTSGTAYTNTAQVISQVSAGVRYIGMTVNVAGVEYWFSPTTADGNLVVKAPTLASVTNSKAFISPVPDLYNVTPSVGPASFRYLENSDLTLSNRTRFPFVGNAFAYGDSFTAGYLASPSTEMYVEKLAAANNVTINNQGVSARGIDVAVKASYSVQSTYNNISPITIFVGFNDCRRGGATSATLNKIEGGHRAMMANNWLKFGVAASAVTNTGTWSNFTTYPGKAGNLGGTTRQSSTAGDVLSYTTTVASDNIVIGTYGTDGTTYNYGRFTVSIDGTIVETYDPNGKSDNISDGATDNGRVANTLIYTGLRNSTHAVIITLLDSKVTLVDYIGYLNEPAACAPVFVMSPPRNNAAGNAVSPNVGANDVAYTATKERIRTVCKSMSRYPVAFIDLDEWWDISTCLNADNIHPNSFGHSQIAAAFQSAILQSRQVFKRLIVHDPGITVLPNTTGENGSINTFSSGGVSSFNLSVNRSASGVSDNAGKAQGQYTISAENLKSKHLWYTASTNNVIPTLRMTLDENGILNMVKWHASPMAVGAVAGSTAGAYVMSTSQTNGSFTSAAFFNGTNWMPVAANATILAGGVNANNVAGYSFYINSGLTSGVAYTPTERGRWGTTGLYLGSAGNATATLELKPANTIANSSPLKLFYNYITASTTSGTGSVATITFPAQTRIPFEVGQTVTVTGMNPSGYNGTYTVTAATLSSVSYANATTGSIVTPGTLENSIPTTPEQGEIVRDNDDFYQTNGTGVRGTFSKIRTNITSAGTLTLSRGYSHYIFSGTTTTWTLPAVAGSTNVQYTIKNRGSGAITLNAAAAANEIYDTSAVNTITIAAGASAIIVSDGTFYNKIL